MFNVYRKLLVLVMLAGALFIFSSPQRAKQAIPCCGPLEEVCDNERASCVLDCNLYINIPVKYAQCVDQCDKDQMACYADAQPCEPDPCP